MDELLDQILDGEPYMMVMSSDLKRRLRQRMRERAHQERAHQERAHQERARLERESWNHIVRGLY